MNNDLMDGPSKLSQQKPTHGLGASWGFPKQKSTLKGWNFRFPLIKNGVPVDFLVAHLLGNLQHALVVKTGNFNPHSFFFAKNANISLVYRNKNCLITYLWARIWYEKSELLSFIFQFQITLQSGAVVESNPTISVGFTISQMAVSGLKVSRLDLFAEKYKPFKGVKYITKAGRFQVRA